jgi:XTP/dITP diphosphohydrolase
VSGRGPRRGVPPRIVLATSNPGKVRELSALLNELGCGIVAQGDLGVPAPPEDAPTFIENAIGKARHAASRTGLPAIADDSGLLVDALDGRPGVLSARFAGPDADDAANRARLLAELAGLPPTGRGARFLCCAVYLDHAEDPRPSLAEATWEGHIADTPRGDGGFGYDPLFLVDDGTHTAAELDPATKNRLSHRGQALRALTASLAGRWGAAG